MKKLGKRRIRLFGLIGLLAQLAFFAWMQFYWIGAHGSSSNIFAWVDSCTIDAPSGAGLPYFPFQWVFVSVLGEYGALGLVIGLIVGIFTWSYLIGLFLAWVIPASTPDSPAHNHTPDGIGRPADGSPKPSA